MIELSPGAVIGQYKLVKNLREPLQSHSWLATAADGQSVVIKLFERGAPSKDAFNKLLRLKHPALELSWSRFEDDKWTGYVRPWYENLTHPGTERFTLDRLLALGMRFAEALQVSHDGGLAHNGLQPSNLFTRDNSQLLITDPCTVTKNADGQDHGVDGLALDLQACGHCLESWTNRLDTAHPRSNDESSIVLPPRLTWLITALKVPEKSLLEEGFHRVRDELDDIRLQWQRALRDGIPANWREGRADYRPDSSLQSIPASADQQKRPWGPLFAMVALTALLIMAIWILPAYFAVEEPDSSVSTTTSKDAAQEEAPAEPEPPTAEELAALLVKREEAQAVLDEVINLKLQLESQEVNRWAEKAFAEAIELRDAGDEPYRIQEFDAALDIYAQAKLALQALVDQSRQVATENIDLGQQAINRGDSASAKDTFGLALNIDPQNLEATRGMARSETLDEVLALVADAQALEESGSWEEAVGRLKEVRALDAETDSIGSEITRLNIAIGERNFRAAMTVALAALETGNLEQARSAFNRAERMKPSASGPQEGLQEVNRQERDLAVLHQRETALAQEQIENWQEALNLYQSLLQHDPNLKFAQDSIVRARDRVNLDSELNRYLAEPASWWSVNGRKQAESLLVEARSVQRAGPRLQHQAQQLAYEIEQAGRQVPVVLRSDNLCNVIVYKLGQLGQFESTRLDLYPGYYTAVGTRDGFRDAREEFLVKPEQEQSVTITCNESI